jgi:hypothetical protein
LFVNNIQYFNGGRHCITQGIRIKSLRKDGKFNILV